MSVLVICSINLVLIKRLSYYKHSIRVEHVACMSKIKKMLTEFGRSVGRKEICCSSIHQKGGNETEGS